MAVMITSQPLLEVATTTIEVNTTRPVQNVAPRNNPTTRQLARRRQRRRQRQRDRQQDMIHQQRQRERQRWTPRSPPRDRPHTNYTRGHWRQGRLQETFGNSSANHDPIRESIDSPTDDMLLDSYMYNLETIDPRNRWEQEQLYEFEGFVVLEHLQFLSDQTEQQENINAEERFAQTKLEEQNDQELLQLEQNERIDFLLLQMNQPLLYE
ncbi:unnamed protein product [Didymodactylos carnosus]|uniref:Uncharacterized protein n=1 Tax=Didymodactylos carnosus TaxID=1234261 RepID=A0A813ZPR1_9BILA|nr:unnamed protein product [Didymodactylos carnosus]CAF1217411.1 unnamed protein product [Didymodactylos carnosus]CAF3683904.1 unnamed protein product [Didymodactylos carnosus]CAF4025834.1 unnamed protein product [Didymodactylos carnosus]